MEGSALSLWPDSAAPAFCNFLLNGDKGILYGFRTTNDSKADVELINVGFDETSNLKILEASLLPSEQGGLTDGYPPTFPTDDQWNARTPLGADATLRAGEELRLMIAVGIVGDVESGTASNLTISYSQDGSSFSETAPASIEVRRSGSCSS